MEEKEVYLDSCKTSRLAPAVLDAMMPYLTDKYWYPGPFTSIGTTIAENIESAQKIVADSMNANVKEIVFTSGGTDAVNIAMKGIMYANKERGKHFISSVVSHPAVLSVCRALESEGYEGTYISADHNGYLDLDELKSAIRDDTIMVAFTHVNHILGTIQPADEISKILAETNHKIYHFMDSCEAYAKIPVDVQAMGLDAMAISAHKFNGPKGMGALYVKKNTQIIPTQHGIVRLHPLKPGSIDVPGIIGMAKAVELVFSDFDHFKNELARKQHLLYDTIQKRIDGVTLNGPKLGERSPAQLSITFDFVEGEAMMMMLNFQNIHVETGAACSSRNLQPNYILMQTGRTPEQANGSLRFTLDQFVTDCGIQRTVDALAAIVEKLRAMSPLTKK